VLAGRGDLAEARSQFEASLAVLQELTALAPQDTGNRFLLGIAHGKVGSTLENLGLHDEAIREYGLGLAIQRRLHELDPANADWRREVAVSHRRLGSALSRTDPATALRHLRLATESLVELSDADTSNSERRLDLARARLDLGRGLLAAGQLADAAAAQRAALGTLGPAAGGADDRSRQLLEGEVHVALGDSLRAAARRQEAREAWTAAVAVLEPLDTGARDPEVLAPLARALLALERRTAAEALIERLRATGYRRWDLEAALR
jgi:tetratricopeptide (TPR) repeat protein